jgi:hypothetical protein
MSTVIRKMSETERLEKIDEQIVRIISLIFEMEEDEKNTGTGWDECSNYYAGKLREIFGVK